MNDEQPFLNSLELLRPDFFDGNAEAIAKRLIGVFLIVDHGIGFPAGGKIIETEAYDEDDPASHCYRGFNYEPQHKSRPMLLRGGNAYVYAECCLNFVCGEKGFGSAVLLRSLVPIWGKEAMRIRQVPYDLEAANDDRRLCSGPQRLGAALGVTYKHNEASLFAAPFRLYERLTEPRIAIRPRVRVKKFIEGNRSALPEELKEKAVKRLLRFVDEAEGEYVSDVF